MKRASDPHTNLRQQMQQAHQQAGWDPDVVGPDWTDDDYSEWSGQLSPEHLKWYTENPNDGESDWYRFLEHRYHDGPQYTPNSIPTKWDPDQNQDPFDPRLIGAARKSHRELLAEIERLADWTKYDDDTDPAVEAYGKNKVPSTSVSQPPKDWAKRKPAGDPGKKGGTWTPPSIPRKKK